MIDALVNALLVLAGILGAFMLARALREPPCSGCGQRLDPGDGWCPRCGRRAEQ